MLTEQNRAPMNHQSCGWKMLEPEQLENRSGVEAGVPEEKQQSELFFQLIFKLKM